MFGPEPALSPADPTLERIRTRLAAASKEELVALVERPASGSEELAARIDYVGTDVLPRDADKAMVLAEKLFCLDQVIFDRADDSNGSIGDELRAACVLWLDAAAEVRATNTDNGTDWPAVLYELYQTHDYGVREPLLEQARRLVRQCCSRAMKLSPDQRMRSARHPGHRLAPEHRFGHPGIETAAEPSFQTGNKHKAMESPDAMRRRSRAGYAHIFLRWISLSVLASSPLAFAGVNQWTGIGPDGGFVVDAEFNPTVSGTLYAVAASGFYRSTDGGTSWQLTQTSLATDGDAATIAVSPTDPQRLLFINDRGPLLSTDGGTTFAPMSGVSLSNGILKVSRDGTTTYLVEAGGVTIYRSRDQWRTWELRNPISTAGDEDIIAIDIDPTNPDIVYALTFKDDLFVSQDGGGTWQQRASALPFGNPVSRLLVDPSNPRRLLVASVWGVFISDDAGSTWPANPLTDQECDIAVDPTNFTVIYAMRCDGRLSKSVTAGLQWSTAASLPAGPNGVRLNISPLAPSQLMAVDADGVAMSSDGGTSWQVRNAGLKAAEIQAMAVGTGKTYIAANSGSLYSLAPGGSSFTEMDNSSLLALPSVSFFDVHLVSIPGLTDDTLYAVLGETILARSNDSGATWARIFPAANRPYTVAASPLDPHTVYAGTSTGIFKSTDDGNTWSDQSAGLPAATEVQHVVISNTPNIVYAITDPASSATSLPFQLFRSTDGAGSWSQISNVVGTNYYGLAVDPESDQTLYAQIDTGFYKSTDGGTTWSAGKLTSGNPLCCSFGHPVFDPTNSRVLYVITQSAVLRSVDAGATWEALTGIAVGDPDVNGPLVTEVTLDPSQPSTLLVGTFGWGVRQMTIAPDLEITVTPPASLTANAPGTYTLSVNNHGPFDATNVRVSAQFPANTGTITAGSGTNCTTAQTTITCTLDILRSNAAAQNIPLSITATSNGTFAMTATVAADQPDAVSGNNAASASVQVGAASAPPPAASSPAPLSSSHGGGAISVEMLLILAMLQLRKRAPRPSAPVFRRWRTGALPHAPMPSGIH